MNATALLASVGAFALTPVFLDRLDRSEGSRTWRCDYVQADRRLHMSCSGCAAEKHNDPVTAMIDGVQLVFQAPGFTLIGNVDLVQHGSCLYQMVEGQPYCAPDDVCEFLFSYQAVEDGSIGKFHDDRPLPCNWAKQAPSGAFYYMPPQQFPVVLGSCFGGVYHRSVRFFRGGPDGDCGLGTLVGEIQLAGKCNECPQQPL